MEVEILGINLLEWQTAEQTQRCFDLRTSKAVHFLRVEHGVELALRLRGQIKAIVGKNFQLAHATVSRTQFVEQQKALRRKNECVIEQPRLHAQGRLDPHLRDQRLAHDVPVLQSGFKIALKEIERGQKLVGVGIRGVQPQRVPKVRDGTRVVLLFES